MEAGAIRRYDIVSDRVSCEGSVAAHAGLQSRQGQKAKWVG